MIYISTPTFFIKGTDSHFIFFPLLAKSIHADLNDEKVIYDLNNSGTTEDVLRKSSVYKYLSDNNLLLDYKPKFKVNTHISEYKPTDTVLLLTDSCNLGCTYCFASSVPSKDKLNIDVAKKAVDLIIKNSIEIGNTTPTIRFLGGGEPTMEWKNLVSIAEYAKNKAKQANTQIWIRLVTNGTLLTDDRLFWISKNINFITLSFEILPELQSQRSFINGKNSHNKVLELLKKLSGLGIKYHIRTTITDKSADKLVEMVEYLKEFNVKHIRFEPLSQIGRSIDTATNKPIADIFVAEFIKARELGKKYKIEITSKQFLDLQAPRSRFCSFEFSIGSNNVITACHRFSREEHSSFNYFKYGYFDSSANEFVFNTDKLNEILAVDNTAFTDCKNCFAKWNCAGGCLSARITNNVLNKSGPLCDLTRSLLKFSISENASISSVTNAV